MSGETFPYPVERGVTMGYAPPQKTFRLFGSKWRIMVHFEHCFYNATHMQRIGIARCMQGSDVLCLSVCQKVTRWCFINAAERIIT